MTFHNKASNNQARSKTTSIIQPRTIRHQAVGDGAAGTAALGAGTTAAGTTALGAGTAALGHGIAALGAGTADIGEGTARTEARRCEAAGSAPPRTGLRKDTCGT